MWVYQRVPFVGQRKDLEMCVNPIKWNLNPPMPSRGRTCYTRRSSTAFCNSQIHTWVPGRGMERSFCHMYSACSMQISSEFRQYRSILGTSHLPNIMNFYAPPPPYLPTSSRNWLLTIPDLFNQVTNHCWRPIHQFIEGSLETKVPTKWTDEKIWKA